MNDKKHPDNKSNAGVTVGVVIGFMAGLLINSVFIPIAIGIGALFDHIKNNRNE